MCSPSTRSKLCTLRYMPREIPQRELRNRNAEIVDAVSRGESFVVTRRGTPVAELRLQAQGRRRLLPKTELAAVALAGPHIDAALARGPGRDG